MEDPRILVELISGKNKSIPGKRGLDEGREIFKEFLTSYSPINSDSIKNYNIFISLVLPKIIREKCLVNNKYLVKFELVHPEKPKIHGGSTSIYPKCAREQSLSYCTKVQIIAYYHKLKNAPIGLENRFEIDYIENYNLDDVYENSEIIGKDNKPDKKDLLFLPVMTGSILCNLAGLSRSQLIERCECVNDPGGIFIRKGTPIVITAKERIRSNLPYISSPGAKNVYGDICTMNCFKDSIVKVIKLKRDKSNLISLLFDAVTYRLRDVYDFMYSHIREIITNYGLEHDDELQEINDVVGLLNNVLTSEEVLIEYYALKVLKFTVSKNRNRMRLLLIETFKRSDFKLIDASELKIDINDLFININDYFGREPKSKIKEILSKLNTLSYITCIFSEYLLGFKEIDDRDDWGFKHLKIASHIFETIVRNTMNSYLKELMENSNDIDAIKIKFSYRENNTKTTQDILCTSAFPANKQRKFELPMEVISGPLLLKYSLLTKTTTSSSVKSKQIVPRSVHPSQICFIDPAMSPEGEKIGINKYKALTCRVAPDSTDIFKFKKIMTDLRIAFDKEPSYDDKNDTDGFIFYNGIYAGYSKDIKKTRLQLIQKRREGMLKDVSVYIRDKIIYVYSDAGRLTRPLLIMKQSEANEQSEAKDKTTELVAKKLYIWHSRDNKSDNFILNEKDEENNVRIESGRYIRYDKSIWEFKAEDIEKFGLRDKLIELLIINQALEFIDPLEQANIYIARTYSDVIHARESIVSLEDRLKSETDHEIKELIRKRIEKTIKIGSYSHMELDPISAFGVISSLIPMSDRTQAPRNTLACSMISQALGKIHVGDLEKTMKGTVMAMNPLFQTMTHNMLGLSQSAYGLNVIVAFMHWHGFGQEDGIVMKKEFIDRGGFMYRVLKLYKAKLESKNQDVKYRFGKPITITNKQEASRWKNIDEFGMPIIGRLLEENDVVIGIIKTVNNEDIPDPMRLKTSESGIVYKVIKSGSIVKVIIDDLRKPEVGDKFASRTAQKSIVTRVEPEINLPYTKSGMTPDIIFNPLSAFARMTINKMIEIIMGKVGILEGNIIDATAFRSLDINYIQSLLKKYGYNEFGTERMKFRDPEFKDTSAEIFIGPCYYMELRHNVLDKIYARSIGSRNNFTFQPIAGRERGGGLKVGNMELRSFFSHGALSLADERIRISSNNVNIYICKTCSLMVRGQNINISQSCQNCSENNIIKLDIPYTTILILQYMKGLGLEYRFEFGKNKVEIVGAEGIIASTEDVENLEEDEEDEEDEVEEEIEEIEVPVDDD